MQPTFTQLATHNRTVPRFGKGGRAEIVTVGGIIDRIRSNDRFGGHDCARDGTTLTTATTAYNNTIQSKNLMAATFSCDSLFRKLGDLEGVIVLKIAKLMIVCWAIGILLEDLSGS